jgi:hypothetical protein
MNARIRQPFPLCIGLYLATPVRTASLNRRLRGSGAEMTLLR